jgi:hypothetical protein
LAAGAKDNQKSCQLKEPVTELTINPRVAEYDKYPEYMLALQKIGDIQSTRN